MKRRLLRLAGATFAALALVHGARVWQQSGRDVQLSYEAPPGELTVTLFDHEGHRLRRAVFPGALRDHTVDLPEGHYRARLELAGRPPVDRRFEVVDDGALRVSYQPRDVRAAADRN